MANINLSFSLEKKNGFVLVIREQGNSNGNRVTVKNLINPDFKRWNKKEQRFIDATQDAIHNNSVLREMRNKYQTIIDTCNPTSPAELKRMVETGILVNACVPLTLGAFLKQLIDGMKHEAIKKPSKNYQNYITLYHKLEAEKEIINVPLCDICNQHFKQFGKFILSLPMDLGKSNYIPLMKRFKSVIRKAYKEELTHNVLTYDYSEKAPTIERKPRFALTESQYNKFVNLDLSVIAQSGVNREYFKELYRDFCIFLYEMKMRPVDVIRLHSDNVVYLGEKKIACIQYIAEKKKNYTGYKGVVTNKLTTIAKSIIEKYKGKSSKGYIFPFSMNEYDWDFSNAKEWGKWTIRKQATLEKINAFIKKTARYVGVEKDRFTLYTFRHSAITHEVEKKNKDICTIAKEAGTSPKKIDKHYFDYIATL